MSVSIQVDLGGIERLRERLERLAGLDMSGLLEAIGAEVESQTRRRIEEEKRGPDGTRWPAWSKGYAATRHKGHSLLIGEGNLLDSIQYVVSGDQVEVGTNLVYAAIHQFGGAEAGMNIPARPYLGLSDDNLDDLAAIVDDWADRQLEAL